VQWLLLVTISSANMLSPNHLKNQTGKFTFLHPKHTLTMCGWGCSCTGLMILGLIQKEVRFSIARVGQIVHFEEIIIIAQTCFLTKLCFFSLLKDWMHPRKISYEHVVYYPEALLSDAVWKKKKKWGEVLHKNKLTAHKHKLFFTYGRQITGIETKTAKSIYQHELC